MNEYRSFGCTVIGTFIRYLYHRMGGMEEIMIRKIIKIDEELCNGCGLCVNACHESAIGLVDGKAKLLRDDYCDGLGNCLPACPTNAINFVEREALEYNEEEVTRNIAKKQLDQSDGVSTKQELSELTNINSAHHSEVNQHSHNGGCPGSRVMSLKIQEEQDQQNHQNQQNQQNQQNHQNQLSQQGQQNHQNQLANQAANQMTNQIDKGVSTQPISMLRQWPVQIQLVPANAPYFKNADLLIAADCTAYAFADFHQFMKNKITIIGCPKLDEVDYSIKLAEILSTNQIKSITVIRMEVPCCGGIVHAVKNAMVNSGQIIPWKVVVISTDGRLLED